MIIKGASRRSVKFWAKHLTDTKTNDRAEMVDKRGLLSENLTDLLTEIQDNADLTDCKNAMYIASFSPAIGEVLNEAQWERAYEIFEQHRGIPEGQRRIVYEHEKEGRTHRHVVWDRIDIENVRAFPDGLDWKVCALASKDITHELGLQHTPGILFREPGAPRPERNPKAWEMFRGMKTEVDVKALAAEVKELHRQSENGQQFKAALEQHGYELVTGKRGLLILDLAGDEHSLARRCGITIKALDAFMRDVDRASLPTVEQAKEQYRERQAEREATAPAPAEPAREQERQPYSHKVAGAPDHLRGTAAEIWQAVHSNDNVKAIAAALDEKAIGLARASMSEATRSRMDAEAAKREGKAAPVFRPNEIVAVDDRAYVHRFTEEKTGRDFLDMQKDLRTLDTSKMKSIDDTRRMMFDRAAAFIGRTGRRALNIFGSVLGKVADIAGDLLSGPPVPLTRQQAAILRDENQRHANAAVKEAAAVHRWQDYTDQHEQHTAKQEQQKHDAEIIAEQSKRLQRDRGEGRER